jgi:hypothetical protein
MACWHRCTTCPNLGRRRALYRRGEMSHCRVVGEQWPSATACSRRAVAPYDVAYQQAVATGQQQNKNSYEDHRLPPARGAASSSRNISIIKDGFHARISRGGILQSRCARTAKASVGDEASGWLRAEYLALHQVVGFTPHDWLYTAWLALHRMVGFTPKGWLYTKWCARTASEHRVRDRRLASRQPASFANRQRAPRSPPCSPRPRPKGFSYHVL